MQTRCVVVCVAMTLSFLASSDLAATKKPVARRAATRDRRCEPCTAKLAQKTRSHSINKRASRNVPCHPSDYVDPKVARNYKTALKDMKRVGIKPNITSAWRSSESQAELRRCSLSTRCRRANPGLYRALPPGNSLHEAGFAVDISGIASGPRGNKRLTPKGRRIVSIMKKNGFKWRYGLSDPAHFEADPRKYGYRSAKQAINKTQTTCQFRLAKDKGRRKPAARAT